MDLLVANSEQLAKAEALYCRYKETNAEKGIGRLQEKSVHGILKFFLDADPTHHEVKLPSGHVADIFDGQWITEIQTGSYSALAGKLAKLLLDYRVRVVCPIVRDRYLYYTNTEDGSVEKPRKSPLHGERCTSLVALSSLDAFLTHPNFQLCFLLLDVAETRVRSEGGYRKRDKRLDTIPLLVADAWSVRSREDYLSLLPTRLPDVFTAAQFGKATHLRGRKRSFALKLLLSSDTVRQIGKEGRAYLYTIHPRR